MYIVHNVFKQDQDISTYMKKIHYVLFALLWLTSGCDLLDQTSPNDIDAEGAITDAASAEAALLGCYSALQQPAYYGGQYLLMTEALADNATTGGYNVISLNQLTDRAVTPANLLGEETWIAIYRVVTNCNYLLAALPDAKGFEPNQRERIEREARTIRALAHFDLLRLYGEHWDTGSAFGVPVITAVQTLDDRPERATVAASYQFIINELEAALALDAVPAAGVQYWGEWGIKGLLARAYFYQGDKTKAAAYAQQVVDSGVFAVLAPDQFAGLYERRRTSESIFELAFDAQNRSEYNGLTYGRDDALRPELSFLAAQDLDAFFQSRSGDLRAATLSFDPAANDGSIVPDGRTQKYRGEEQKDNPAYILRLPEMHLILAECYLGLTGKAHLDAVRNARGLAPSTADLDAALLQDILEERRAEFQFEGHRLFDLARTQQFATIVNTDAYRAIMPIPNREIIASGGKITQNPGY
jgi:starch-binding outer membrane protein, SusD/RagB family